MRKKHMAFGLVASAFIAAPVLAQTSTAPAAKPPAGASQTAATAPASKVNAAEFVNQAAVSDMFEIQSSQLALSKTQDNRIRDFAQRMVDDHTQASEKLKAAAQNQTVPTALDQEHAQMLQQLQQASGADFERPYVQMQFNGHQKAVGLFENYAQNGDHAQLKQFAQQTVPKLREHFQQITQIRNEMFAPARVGQAQPGQAGQQTAQANQPSGSAAPSSAPMTTGTWLTQDRPDLWRLSRLRGLDVYNNNDEKIGDINELIVDSSGKVQAVVVGVGGFLGMGEHNVAVPFDQVKITNEPRASRTAVNTGPATTGVAPAPGTPAGPNVPARDTTATGSTAMADQNRLDHAVLNMTRDQLRAAPAFKYSR